MTICLRIPLGFWPAITCLLFFLCLMLYFLWVNRKSQSFYFDPKDVHHYEQGGGRELPIAAKDSTFEPHLKNYIDVMKLLVTIAAASIAFGGTQNATSGVRIAKSILAFSILYGVVFSGLLQFFYEQYAQDVRAYTRVRYSVITALGFSALVCFIVGYFFWAFSFG